MKIIFLHHIEKQRLSKSKYMFLDYIIKYGNPCASLNVSGMLNVRKRALTRGMLEFLVLSRDKLQLYMI
jgi:hypothetical protein